MAVRISLWSIILCSLWVLGASAQDYAVTDYIVAGTGCPPGTASATISATGKSVSLKYSTFVVNAGPTFDLSDNRKNCQVTLVVQVPTGYQFAFNRFIYSSAYALDSDVDSSFQTAYYFQASLSEGLGGGNITGPASSNSRTLSSPSSPAVWSPCGKSSLVNVDTSLRVSNSANTGSSGHLTFNSLTIPASSFTWRTC